MSDLSKQKSKKGSNQFFISITWQIKSQFITARVWRSRTLTGWFLVASEQKVYTCTSNSDEAFCSSKSVRQLFLHGELLSLSLRWAATKRSSSLLLKTSTFLGCSSIGASHQGSIPMYWSWPSRRQLSMYRSLNWPWAWVWNWTERSQSYFSGSQGRTTHSPPFSSTGVGTFEPDGYGLYEMVGTGRGISTDRFLDTKASRHSITSWSKFLSKSSTLCPLSSFCF